MNSTHPNLIMSYVLRFMSQREHMLKNPFLVFRIDRLWSFNFQFGCWPKSSNHNILVSTHPIWKMKRVLKISGSRQSMVRNPFWYFQFFTFRNPCDSSSSPRAKFWPMTPEKFLRNGFSFFYLNLLFSLKSRSRWHFGCWI